MGLLNLVRSGIGTISACTSAIGASLGTVGGSIVKAVATVLPALTSLQPQVVLAAQVITTVIEVVSTVTGLLKAGESVAGIGARSLQAEEQGITLDKCQGNFKNYMEELRRVELETETVKRHSAVEQQLAGALVLEDGVRQLYPHLSTSAIWPLALLQPELFNKSRLEAYALASLAKGYPFGEPIAQVFIPHGQRVDREQMDFVYNVEKQLNPTATPNDISSFINDVKKKLQGSH